MPKRVLFPSVVMVFVWTTMSALAQGPYDGSLAQFVAYLTKNGHSDLALPEWSSGAKIDYFRGPDGENLRYAFWPRASASPALGTVVHFNGRTEFIERNILTYRDLAKRGWDIWTMDWRGQGLSYRPLEGDKAVRGHIDDFATYVADATAFIDNVVKPQERPGLHVLLAHSMGGQAALRYLIDHPNAFDRVILSSPLVGLPRSWIATLDENSQGTPVQGARSDGRLRAGASGPMGKLLQRVALRCDSRSRHLPLAGS